MNTLEFMYAEVEIELQSLIEEMDYLGHKYSPENVAATRLRMRKEALMRYEYQQQASHQLYWMTHYNPYITDKFILIGKK